MLSYLKAKRSCTLDELMAHFKVSSATIHRDAAALSRRDAIERVRGGLLYRDAPDPAAGAADYQGRIVTHRAQKIAAARKALALIEEGDIIRVKIINIDEKTGKLKLSRKALLEKPEGYVEEKPARREGGRGGDRGPRRDGDRGGRREGGDRGGERRASGNGGRRR